MVVIEDILDNVGPEQDENGVESVVENMLILAKVKMIFITGASMGLCFGFVLEMVLITQGCYYYC